MVKFNLITFNANLNNNVHFCTLLFLNSLTISHIKNHGSTKPTVSVFTCSTTVYGLS